MAKLKIPKSLGACADLLYDTRQRRLAAEKVADAIKAEETEISEYIIDNLSKRDEGGAVGKRYKALRTEKVMPRIEDGTAFYDYVRKNAAFDLLQKRLNEAAVADRVNALNTKIDAYNAKALAAGRALKPRLALPGVGSFTAVKLSLTKV